MSWTLHKYINTDTVLPLVRDVPNVTRKQERRDGVPGISAYHRRAAIQDEMSLLRRNLKCSENSLTQGDDAEVPVAFVMHMDV